MLHPDPMSAERDEILGTMASSRTFHLWFNGPQSTANTHQLVLPLTLLLCNAMTTVGSQCSQSIEECVALSIRSMFTPLISLFSTPCLLCITGDSPIH